MSDAPSNLAFNDVDSVIFNGLPSSAKSESFSLSNSPNPSQSPNQILQNFVNLQQKFQQLLAQFSNANAQVQSLDGELEKVEEQYEDCQMGKLSWQHGVIGLVFLVIVFAGVAIVLAVWVSHLRRDLKENKEELKGTKDLAEERESC